MGYSVTGKWKIDGDRQNAAIYKQHPTSNRDKEAKMVTAFSVLDTMFSINPWCSDSAKF